MVEKRPYRNNIVFLLLAVFLIAGMSACTSNLPIRSTEQVSAIQGAEHRAWEEAIRAFEQRDYRKAAGLFEMLSEAGHTDELGKRALFALAATKLAQAQTPEDYANALVAWQKWSSLTHGPSGEDARMLTPFLVRFASIVMLPEKGAEPPLVQPRKASRDTGAAALNYKNMLQSKEKEIDGLRGKLDSREREVRRLRHQLESLEEIHRKYQEKKQEASTP